MINAEGEKSLSLGDGILTRITPARPPRTGLRRYQEYSFFKRKAGLWPSGSLQQCVASSTREAWSYSASWTRLQSSVKTLSLCCTEKPAQTLSLCCTEKPAQTLSLCCTEKPAQKLSLCCTEKPAQTLSLCCTEKPAQKLSLCCTEKPAQTLSLCCTKKETPPPGPDTVSVLHRETGPDTVSVLHRETGPDTVSVLQKPGSPMPSSLPSPSEHCHSQPPSPNLHDNQSSVLSSAPVQAVGGSDSEEEFTPALYRAVAPPSTNGFLKMFTLPSSPGYAVPSSPGYTVPSSLGYTVPSSLGYTVPSSLGYAVPSSLGYTVPSSIGYAVPSSLGYAVPSSLGYAVPSSLGYAVPSSLGYAVPSSFGYTELHPNRQVCRDSVAQWRAPQLGCLCLPRPRSGQAYFGWRRRVRPLGGLEALVCMGTLRNTLGQDVFTVIKSEQIRCDLLACGLQQGLHAPL
ncbi:hypothetical protein P4O66_002047 [Electrophorus voltai]|uniref:Uncharacterized protein n=1 Tax=Electrophorus voltai TaxID=2609070 RepID=A0AAD9DS32_9TELE|nr:hypothetical protein P4O66_002047 [Electrophorus voltai]